MTAAGGTIVAAAVPFGRARSQSAPKIRIGVLNDVSGNFRDTGGRISFVCAQQATADFGASAKGFDVEVLLADHQNRPDVGVSIARQWFDRDGVDMILDVPNSSVALAVSTVAREKNKVLVTSGAASTDLTGHQCTPNTVQWMFDTDMLGKSTGAATVKLGGNKWFFVTADYVFGKQLQDSTAQFVKAAGGSVVGNVLFPFPGTTDFASYLLQASSSGANIIGLAAGGGDVVSCVKQATEFGLTQQAKLAGLGMLIPNVHALGLEASQGMLVTESFYWDLNERTRAVTARMRAQTGGVPPCMTQGGCYSGTLHYLKAVAEIGAAQAKTDGAAVVTRMKAMPTDDDCLGKNSIRADGKAMIPAYLPTPLSTMVPRSRVRLRPPTSTTKSGWSSPLARAASRFRWKPRLNMSSATVSALI
jgi:branched-chain amino acid transport system substrate-binding protein